MKKILEKKKGDRKPDQVSKILLLFKNSTKEHIWQRKKKDKNVDTQYMNMRRAVSSPVLDKNSRRSSSEDFLFSLVEEHAEWDLVCHHSILKCLLVLAFFASSCYLFQVFGHSSAKRKENRSDFLVSVIIILEFFCFCFPASSSTLQERRVKRPRVRGSNRLRWQQSSSSLRRNNTDVFVNDSWRKEWRMSPKGKGHTLEAQHFTFSFCVAFLFRLIKDLCCRGIYKRFRFSITIEFASQILNRFSFFLSSFRLCILQRIHTCMSSVVLVHSVIFEIRVKKSHLRWNQLMKKEDVIAIEKQWEIPFL